MSDTDYFEDPELVRLQQFMVSIITHKYDSALAQAKSILALSPKNSLIKQYIPLIEERLGQLKREEEVKLDEVQENKDSDEEGESSTDTSDTSSEEDTDQ